MRDTEPAFLAKPQLKIIEGRSELEELAHFMVDVFALPALPVKQRFSILLNRACRVFGMDYGYITLPQEPVSAVPFISARMVVPPAGPSKITLTHMLTSNRKTLHYDNPEMAPSADCPDQTGFVPSRFMGAPVVFDGRVFGTVEFGSRAGGGAPISAEQLMLVRMAAGLTAGTLVLLTD
ncbi:GAF domain-containing protein [Sulfitobacter sp. S190]|uniref:GAF domain-containing protein n=1 Tax=Sulfitobacter sp. S190 TaxID=2867022 RepID=UPI0021A47D59|nr:GAF domain-containing protein [Sulfitobacter sp. S190]UWR23954.1 GAF domain-containing protein [Sulfitobacter sp. S190]